MFTPERPSATWSRSAAHRRFNEAGVVHAGEARRPRASPVPTWPLQRGRRCSRRRGNRVDRVARRVVGFNEAGVVHAGEATPARARPARCWCFNEAGVVHAGEACKTGPCRGRPRSFNEAGVVHAGEGSGRRRAVEDRLASTRPALFTPERKERGGVETTLHALQRGRRCSRRRGTLQAPGIA